MSKDPLIMLIKPKLIKKNREILVAALQIKHEICQLKKEVSKGKFKYNIYIDFQYYDQIIHTENQ